MTPMQADDQAAEGTTTRVTPGRMPKPPMQVDDRLAEWLVRWEEARAAARPPPALDQLPAELHPHAREGLRLLRGFARTSLGLTTPGDAPPGDAPPAPPDTPRYRFEAFLARGGMGEVWRGFDTLLARGVALKVVRAPVLADGGFRSRFEEEARHVGGLEHRSIVPIYDLGELADGRPFFVMKLIHGQTLAELLAARAGDGAGGGPAGLGRGVRAGLPGGGVRPGARGVIHRDLKPSNVMLCELGEVQVLDWGIAKALAGGSQSAQGPSTPVVLPPSVDERATALRGSETLPGHVRGTPEFMAPEQACGEVGRIGAASDVFGLGGILCVILTGQPPFSQWPQSAVGYLEEAFARLDGCGADAERSPSAKACSGAPAPEGIVPRTPRRSPVGCSATATRSRRARARRSGCCGSARWEWRSPRPPRTLVRGYGNRPGGCPQAEVAAQGAPRLSGRASRLAEAAAARQVLEGLRDLPVLAGVRDPAALADLPEPERREWQAFWRGVEGLLRGPDPAQ